LNIPNLVCLAADNTVFALTTIPPGPRKEWFSFALSDVVLLHGTLLVSAWHLAVLHKRPMSKAYYLHRGEAIRLVNKRLPDSIMAANDGTIGAIACLLITDVSQSITNYKII